MICRKCDKKFKSKSRYETHVEEDICGLKECEVCEKSYATVYMLERHKKSQAHKKKEREAKNSNLENKVDMLEKELLELRKLLVKQPAATEKPTQATTVINNTDNSVHIESATINLNLTLNIVPEKEEHVVASLKESCDNREDIKNTLTKGIKILCKSNVPIIVPVNQRLKQLQCGDARYQVSQVSEVVMQKIYELAAENIVYYRRTPERLCHRQLLFSTTSERDYTDNKMHLEDDGGNPEEFPPEKAKLFCEQVLMCP